MNTGLKQKPRLSAKPPGSSLSNDLERLERLNSWTEEPARAVAESLDAEPKPAEEGRAVKPPKASPQQPKMPWDDVPDDVHRQFNVRLPYKLAIQLKWLGDTTFDSSMSKIVIESLEKTAKRMLAERGVK